MSCGTEIKPYDNLPLVSYAILRGRCRSCGERIPVRYPIVEATTAALVVACGLRFGLTADAVVAAFFCAVLVVISAIDLERRIIPNRIVLPATAIVLVGCYYGYTASGGPVGVGTATAKSMVLNIVLVHIIGMMGTLVFWGANPRAPIGG